MRLVSPNGVRVEAGDEVAERLLAVGFKRFEEPVKEAPKKAPKKKTAKKKDE